MKRDCFTFTCFTIFLVEAITLVHYRVLSPFFNFETKCQRKEIRNNAVLLKYIHLVRKTKSTAFKGRDPVRPKIAKTVIDNKIIEQVNSFNYLGNMISYEKELDIDNKLHNYLKITAIVNNVFRPQKTPQENKNKTI